MKVALSPECVPNPVLPPGAELGSSAPSSPKKCVVASSEKPQIATHMERAQSDRARGKGETRAGPKGIIPAGLFKAKGNHPPRLGTVVGNIHCSRAPLASCPSFSSWKLCQSPTPSLSSLQMFQAMGSSDGTIDKE